MLESTSRGGRSLGRFKAPGCGPGDRGFKSHRPPHFAPVAQLDRASDFESGGSGFKSLRAYQTSTEAKGPLGCSSGAFPLAFDHKSDHNPARKSPTRLPCDLPRCTMSHPGPCGCTRPSRRPSRAWCRACRGPRRSVPALGGPLAGLRAFAGASWRGERRCWPSGASRRERPGVGPSRARQSWWTANGTRPHSALEEGETLRRTDSAHAHHACPRGGVRASGRGPLYDADVRGRRG